MPRSAHDTIAALATPAGTSALAVIRVSGVDTPALATALLGRPPAPRVAVHADYRAGGGEVLDDVLMTFFPAPRSYSGDDTLEISTHGNPFIVQRVLEDLFARGCRPAEPGEFTQRAFLNGRMDLSQAEAVMDLIQARGDRALSAAHAQLRGILGKRMDDLAASLLQALAQVEAYIDFPEEDLPPEDRSAVLRSIDSITLSINMLHATAHYGAVLRDGIRTVIIGLPNAGKSSLLNALVGRERALVSPEPGTTRDYLEERVIVGPHCLRLIDTAGLNASPSPLERQGMEKSLERALEADLFMVVQDRTQATPTLLPPEVQARMHAGNAIVVWSKADLPAHPTPPGDLAALPQVTVSALTGTGLDELRSLIVRMADGFNPADTDGIAISARHADALLHARVALGEATAKLATQAPIELVAADLRAGLAAIGEITGRIDNERMLDALFATFCIGK